MKKNWLTMKQIPEHGESYLPLSVVPRNNNIHNDQEPGTSTNPGYQVIHYLDAAQGLAWILDKDANLVYANRSFYNYFKLDPSTFLNKRIIEMVPVFVTESLYQKHISVIHSGHSIDTVQRIRWADGSSVSFHINLFPLSSEKGEPWVGGYAVRLEDKFLVESQLKGANNRLLNLTRATSDAIWEWDMQTGEIFRNEQLLELIGFPVESKKGLSWWLHRIHPEDRNRVSDIVKDTTDKNGQSWEGEYRFRCGDGSYKHVRDRGFVVYENGLPVRMIGSIQDISDIKELQSLLTEEILQRQKEVSETVIRVQEDERTRIGHELHDNVNQILSTTKLFVEMFSPGGNEQKLLKEKSISYLHLAIEEIRKLSKELVVPALKEIGLVNSIVSLIDDIHISTPVKIKFTHDHECDLASSAKRVTLFRIIQEQFKNILKYAAAKNVEVLLERRNDQIILMIKDDGKGFDLSHTPRGIGLSNIHERTRFYNGQVEIITAPGKGCCLQVTIPDIHPGRITEK